VLRQALIVQVLVLRPCGSQKGSAGVLMSPSTWLCLVILAAATWVLMWLNLIVVCIQLFPGSPRATLALLLLAGSLAIWADAAWRRRHAQA